MADEIIDGAPLEYRGVSNGVDHKVLSEMVVPIVKPVSYDAMDCA